MSPFSRVLRVSGGVPDTEKSRLPEDPSFFLRLPVKSNAAKSRRLLAMTVIAASLACSGGEKIVGASGRSSPASATFDGAPTTGTVGAAITGPLAVIVRAADDRPLAGVTVTFTPSAGTLSTESAVTDAQGRAVAGTWTLGTVAGTQTLTARAGTVSGELTVTAAAAAATRLEFVRNAPATARAGVPITPAVQLRAVDQFGNAATSASASITATLQSGGGTLTNATASAGANGVVTFDQLSIGGTVGARVLSFTLGALPSLSSSTVALEAGLAASITLQNVPSSLRAGVVISPAVVAVLSDAFSNPLTRSSSSVTVSLDGGAGTVVGGSASLDSTGRATFAALSVEGLVGNRRLRFSADQISQLTSNIPLLAGPAATLVVTAQPSTATNAERFATPVRIQVSDRFTNPVPDSRDIAVSIASGGGTLIGASARTDAAGVATFADLRVVGLVGPRTLSFSSTGLPSATSNVIQLAAGAIRSLTLVQQPSTSVQVGAPFPQQPSLQAADTSGNVVRRADIVVRATLLDATGLLLNEAALTDDNGLATFSQLTYLPPAQTPTGFRLRFSSGQLAAVESTPIAVQNAPASAVRTVQMATPAQRLFVLDVGGTQAAPATARDANGAVVSVPIVYVSGNAVVATVSSAGTITARSPGAAWIRAFGAGTPQFADSVYVTVTRDAAGPVISTSQLVPIVVRQGQVQSFDVILDTRGTTVGAATILIGFPPELIRSISWTGSAGTQIGFDTGFNALRISVASAAGLTGAVTLVRVNLTPDAFSPLLANRQILVQPLEVVSVSLQDLAPRATGVNIPLIP